MVGSEHRFQNNFQKSKHPFLISQKAQNSDFFIFAIFPRVKARTELKVFTLLIEGFLGAGHTLFIGFLLLFTNCFSVSDVQMMQFPNWGSLFLYKLCRVEAKFISYETRFNKI